MRNKPTPSSLGLTKRTCGSLYRKGGKEWFRLFVGGAQWYTNGHVMMDKAPPFPNVEEYIGQLNPDMKTAGIIGELKHGQRFPITPGPDVTFGDGEPGVKFLDEKGEVAAHVAENYASLMCWAYKDCTFLALDSKSPIEVLDTEHKLVALVMPSSRLIRSPSRI